MKPLKRVAQIDDTGCGIACVAMLLRIDYPQAKRFVFSQEPNSKSYRTSASDLRSALRKKGRWLGPKTRLRGRTKPFSSSAAELSAQIGKRRAIVMMNEYKRNDELRWHWAVWDGFRLHDPWRYKRHRYVAYYSFLRKHG